jgi:hypothetical protein
MSSSQQICVQSTVVAIQHMAFIKMKLNEMKNGNTLPSIF